MIHPGFGWNTSAAAGVSPTAPMLFGVIGFWLFPVELG
jgi:hypothetical protein